MINMSTITRAVEDMLNEHTANYTIARNAARNEDPNTAALGNGWVGIWSGDESYEPYSTGPHPWLAEVETIIEVQYADFNDPGIAEDKIEEAKGEILGIINDHYTLDGTVLEIIGIKVQRFRNEDVDAFHYGARITVRAQARA
jgi:hypothetical protein